MILGLLGEKLLAKEGGKMESICKKNHFLCSSSLIVVHSTLFLIENSENLGHKSPKIKFQACIFIEVMLWAYKTFQNKNCESWVQKGT